MVISQKAKNIFNRLYVLGYFHKSGVGGGFIRPRLFGVFLTGSINRIPTLVQRQASLFL